MLDRKFSDGILTLVLNRPEALNAMDPGLQHELSKSLGEAAADPEVGAIVLTGAGERSFCVGADLKKTPPPQESVAELTFGRPPSDWAGLNCFAIDKPIICAINGLALGGGLELALACDIRIASSKARFGLPEVRVGSIPGWGGTQRLPRTVGSSDAMLLLLTGDMIDAQDALRIGLISRVVEPQELATEAASIAARIVANAPLSVRSIKALTRQSWDLPLAAGLAQEQLVFGLLRDTEDRREGRKAFAEKRTPEFRGR